MKDQSGVYFHHYTKRKYAFEKILPTRKIKFSSYMNMKDPIENKFWHIGGAFSVKDIDDSKLKQETLDSFDSGLRKVWEAAKLLALTVDTKKGYEGTTSDRFGRGWSRARMWEQYAEGHSGVCLFFDREKLSINIKKTLEGMGHEVLYEDDMKYRPMGNVKEFLGLLVDEMVGRVSSNDIALFIENNSQKLFFTKALDWETEWEYRFVTTAFGADKDIYVDYGDALEAVMIGEECPDWQKPSVIDACKEAGVEALRISWSQGEPIPMTLSIHR